MTLDTPLLTEPEIRHRIWTELQRAPVDRHHEWRTPVLATLGKEGLPQARTVVLRAANPADGCLQMFTDFRSPKVAELVARPEAQLVFWSKRLSWQLRVRIHATVQHTGPEVDGVWERVRQSAAAGDYLSARAPGDVLPSTGMQDTQDATTSASQPHHLAIISGQVLEMDWVELARSGHRRAVFSAHRWEWRVP
jgi:pyridoxamine 5'-phosphate oxidase